MMDQIDRMLSVIASEGSCIELRMQSEGGSGCESGYREMVQKLREQARLRLKGEKLHQVLKALDHLSKK
jgi:hypothetical protein